MNFFLILGKFHSLFLYCQKMFNELTSISVISSSLWWGGQFYSSRYLIFHQFSEAATGGVLLKKVFLEISQNSQENTCARVFFNKVTGQGTGVFLWILGNFQEHLFLQNTSGGCFWIKAWIPNLNLNCFFQGHLYLISLVI